MKEGDDVTINGTIYDIRKRFTGDLDIFIYTGGGNIICIAESDINTIRPKIKISDKDERRGT